MPAPFTLGFSKVIVTPLNAKVDSEFTVPANCIWKIESAGIAGTNGVIYLKSDSDPVAILFSSIRNNNYAAPLPFWLDSSFHGFFLNENENNFMGSVSITEYVLG